MDQSLHPLCMTNTSSHPSSLCVVKEIDLALWRSAEAIANDKREFMNDGEWELLSIPSRYWQIHQDDTKFAHIQFNVCAPLSHHSPSLSLLSQRE